MLFDHQLVPQAIIRPQSFVGLMALYESNFLRLQQLIPDLVRLDGYYRSTVVNDCDLHLEIIERSRYTMTLSLSYFFIEDNVRIADPDMKIRVYLDGQLAEAMSFVGEPRHHALRRISVAQGRELGIRWHRNIVLNKWLDYLMEQGHLILER